MKFKKLRDLCEEEAHLQGASVSRLDNGASIISVGNGTPIFLLSGVHGNERSGPIALLRLLKKTDLKKFCEDKKIHLRICPLLNNIGWDNRERMWNGLDLNRSLQPSTSTPKFIQRLMSELKRELPVLIVDLHEDSETSYPYVFSLTTDTHNLPKELAKYLGSKVEYYTPEEGREYDGSSENFTRSLGCELGITNEVPTAWSLERRVSWHLKSLNWLLRYPLRR